MNKLLTVLALLAVASALCCSALEEIERDKEVGLLLGNERLFEQYCLEERAAIVEDIKTRAAEKSSVVFEIFFGAATEIADEVLNVDKEAAREFAKQIEQPAEKVDEGPLPEDKIQALIEQVKREIQSKNNVLGRLVSATKSVVAPAYYNLANSALFVRLAKARSLMDARDLLSGIVQTCSQVAQYEQRLEQELVQAKEQLKGENEADELRKFIDSVSVASLNCYTTKYISRLDAFCRLFKDGASPFIKMLGLSPDSKLPPADSVEPTKAPAQQ